MYQELEVEIRVLSEEQAEENDLEEGTDIDSLLNRLSQLKPIDENFQYRKLTLRVDDIKSRLAYDDNHTIVFTDANAFVVKCNYEALNLIIESIRGTQIKRISDYNVKKV